MAVSASAVKEFVKEQEQECSIVKKRLDETNGDIDESSRFASRERSFSSS